MVASEFMEDYLSKTLETLSFENKHLILLGDFNINLLNYDTDHNTNDFLDLLTSNSLLPLILRPTRITTHSKTLIDNIFINIISPENISGNITCSISDHLAQFTIFKITFPQHIKISKAPKRNFKKFNEQAFLLDILDVNWDKHLDLDRQDATLSTNKFLHIINTILDRHAPYVKPSKNPKYNSTKPWITTGLLKSISKKNQLYKEFITTKSPTKKANFKKKIKYYRNLILLLSRKSKTNYYKIFFEENKNNLKNAWKGIKTLINAGKRKENLPTSMLINNKITTDHKIISESFNNFFGSIAETTKQNIIDTNKHFSDYLNNPNNNSLFLKPTTENKIKGLISALDPQKATGPNSVPTNILKLISPTISKHLSNIINISFSTGVFPSALKEAYITPVHKKDSKLNINNYRPISLLSNISKIIQKLMHSRIENFLTKFNCLYNNQFGFRNKHSTNHALIQLTETIKNAIDKGNYACGVFVDLQKAFDTVEHSILLKN